MGNYYAFICENGHCITSSSYSCPDKFCSKCGARIISKCPNCENIIRGRSDEYLGLIADYVVPNYCRNCGKPYPWISNAIEATSCLLEAETNLSDADRQSLIAVLPDAISETPRTPLAVVRFKKAMATAGSFVAEGLRKFAIDFGCELLKKQLDLQ